MVAMTLWFPCLPGLPLRELVLVEDLEVIALILLRPLERQHRQRRLFNEQLLYRHVLATDLRRASRLANLSLPYT